MPPIRAGPAPNAPWPEPFLEGPGQRASLVNIGVSGDCRGLLGPRFGPTRFAFGWPAAGPIFFGGFFSLFFGGWLALFGEALALRGQPPSLQFLGHQLVAFHGVEGALDGAAVDARGEGPFSLGPGRIGRDGFEQGKVGLANASPRASTSSSATGNMTGIGTRLPSTVTTSGESIRSILKWSGSNGRPRILPCQWKA